ncbi:MAG: hypothetical protein AAGC78_07200 [Cellvibrio sp.]|uniref:hypothetical protein n=1 Tax=Cellvibrio sp. TaxID=1965322 RepID=UPI0031ADFFBB
MKKIIVIQAIGLLLTSLCVNALAEDLPKSGSFNIQSISKAYAPVKFNDDYTHNTATGVTFNEKGSGPLHLGKSACSISSLTRKDINKVIGFCNFEDKDGDSIFVQYSGKSNAKGEFSGENDIIGGTGKFKGISGNGPVACANTDKKGEFPCTQQFDYQLPE